jgi:hypothetical protein
VDKIPQKNGCLFGRGKEFSFGKLLAEQGIYAIIDE